MSLETRSSSALFKRAEQLKRWQESETNREKTVPKRKNKKIQFSSGVVFLAACASGDKDEVLRLLQSGADIDTANVDGLTALHQLCIDDNLEMVEFLVENGADVNRGDNEGWTPLHATASCGFVSIARYLIEHGSNAAAVNNDAELPVDLAETDEMEELLREILQEQGIDCDEARNREQQMMLADAKEWLNGGDSRDLPHVKTGARALHVAAAKGYIKVISLLLQAGAEVNSQDFDGWTALHAAAHWGQKEACEILVENFCDMDIRNLVGQTALDVADPEMVPVLEELKKKQATLQKDRGETNAILHKKGGNAQKRRMSGADKSNLINKDASSERQLLVEQGANKVKTVELEIENSPSEREESSKVASISVNEIEKRNRVNRDEVPRIPLNSEHNKTVPTTPASTLSTPSENDDSSGPGWKRPGSFRNRGANGHEEPSNKPLTNRPGEKDNKAITPTGIANRANADASDVVLRRTQSFEDERFYRRYMELQARIKAGSCPTLHSSAPPARSASLREKQLFRRTVREETSSSSQDTPSTTATPTATGTATPTSTSPTATSPLPTNQVRRSFVPPVRDEESETQRKAHAKRVRETRRSTQGVTLEEIKTAEQLVKKKNQQLQANQVNNTSNSNDQSVVLIPTTTTTTVTNSVPSVTATITAGTPAGATSPKEEEASVQERRPSWRLRVDNGDRNKFLLEDARSRTSVTEPPSAAPTPYMRRPPPLHLPARPASAPLEPTSPPADASVTIALRRNSKPPDDKDQDKENDSRNAQATQAVIQRRRRPKRRSTGVVHVDMDEIDPERQDSLSGGDCSDATSLHDSESGGDWSGNSPRLANSPGGDSRPITPAPAAVSSPGTTSASSRSSKDASENGEIDYKKLYEASVVENERLRDKLKKTEDNLSEARTQLDKLPVGPMKNSLSEMEKRERRAMERKLSEMEEELKLLEQLKNENQRLKDENGALIRVISKLSK